MQLSISNQMPSFKLLQMIKYNRFLVSSDYCNSILAGLPAVTIHPLTTVLHAAARIVKNIHHRDHITPAMRNLHWLPIPARVTFKLCSLMYNIFSHRAPTYMSSLINARSNQAESRGLRSTSRGDAVIPETNRNYGKRAFSVAGPTAWNSLPVQIRRANTVKKKSNLHLKLTFLAFIIHRKTDFSYFNFSSGRYTRYYKRPLGRGPPNGGDGSTVSVVLACQWALVRGGGADRDERWSIWTQHRLTVSFHYHHQYIG